jgi:hypothetical protein
MVMAVSLVEEEAISWRAAAAERNYHTTEAAMVAA